MDSADSAIRKPFIEHVYELRKRALISVIAITAGGLVGYALNSTLLHIIQKPLGQTLFYTSPTGGFSFIFKLCLVFGCILALPVVIYHLLKFLSPLMRRTTKSFIMFCIVICVTLAAAGISFAYFISLPAALHFLANFGGQEIQSLITADEYFSFALAYLGGFAILFQLPLVLLLINRVTPLRPGPLMRAQRYVLLFSFIAAAVLTPTPDPINQLIMAVPVVVLYQISIILVWIINARKAKKMPGTHGKGRVVKPASYPLRPSPAPSIQPVYQTSDAKNILLPRASRYIDIIPVSQKRNAMDFVPRPMATRPPLPISNRPVRLIDMVKT